MKNRLLKLSKMQRRVRAQRKTSTKAEAFIKRLENDLRLARLQNKELAQHLLDEAQREIEEEMHDHSHEEPVSI